MSLLLGVGYVGVCLAAAVALLLGACARKPARRSWECHVLGRCDNDERGGGVRGFVALGFERVKEEFERSFDEGREEASQVAVYHEGRLVVDLWAGSAHFVDSGTFKPITAENVGMVWSCSKVVESLVIAMLVDRGLLRYDEPIAAVWPEFASNGKEGLTVEQLMRHRAGLLTVSPLMQPGDLDDPAGRLGPLLQAQVPEAICANSSCYHPIMRGFYSSELCRRTDPRGRTLAQFFREEVAQPLNLSLYIGITPDEREACGVMAQSSPPLPLVLKHLPQFFMPLWLRRCFTGNDDHDTIREFEAKHIQSLVWRALTLDWELISVLIRSYQTSSVPNVDVNSPEVQRLEAPSALGIGNARSMAKLASVIADPNSRQLFRSPKSRQDALRPGPSGMDLAIGINISFSSCGWGIGRFDEFVPGFVGWAGASGSMLQWKEQPRLGFAYVPSLAYGRPHKPRGLRLLQVASECAAAAAAAAAARGPQG